MGRTRRRDRHLPACMYHKHGAYYFQNPKTREWEPLGDDLGAAITKYIGKIGGQWSGRTLGDVIDRYRVEILPLKGERARVDQVPQLERLKSVFGHMLPDSVTTQHCYQYIDGRRFVKRDKAGKILVDRPARISGEHEIALLGHIYRKAIRWGPATINPVRAMEKDKKKRRTRYVTDAELDTVKRRSTKRMQVAIEGALLTRLRRSTLLKLTREDLTDDGILVPATKGGLPLLIEWTQALRDWVDDCKALTPQVPGTYLIRTQSGRRYTAQGFSANFKRAMKKAADKDGIEPYRFQDIRRKSADDTADIEEASVGLGHKSVRTTEQFYRTKPRRVRPLR